MTPVGIEARFTKTFASATVDVELALATPRERGHVVVLFGPSGCGKTTVLRALAGLERPGAGHIHAVHVTSREVWLDAARGVCLTPQQRDIGFLAQGLALFPHLSVAANVGFGLAGLAAPERDQRCVEVLRLLRIEELATRMPASLSGGQAQRVALARTLAPRPRLLLLDEPLSALDAPTRIALRRDLRVVLAATQTLAVVVTHDRDEAIALGDEVVVMSHGRVLQSGPVLEVFGRPRTSEVARVVGMDTVVAGRVLEVNAGLVVVQVGAVRIEGVAAGVVENEVAVCIRAEGVSLTQGTQGERSSGRNRLPGKVMAIEPEGSLRRVTVDVGFPLAAFITQQSLEELALTPGDDVTACIKAAQVHVVARSFFAR